MLIFFCVCFLGRGRKIKYFLGNCCIQWKFIIVGSYLMLTLCCRYADFLSRMNDDRNIRALFERALSSLPPEESVEVVSWKHFAYIFVRALHIRECANTCLFVDLEKIYPVRTNLWRSFQHVEGSSYSFCLLSACIVIWMRYNLYPSETGWATKERSSF